VEQGAQPSVELSNALMVRQSTAPPAQF